jgi:hypothetical protein
MFMVGLVAAQTPAGPRRPAAVPADYVVTPFGYYHPVCVNHLAKGDVLLQDEKAIHRANGTYEKIPACAYPHFKADGVKVIGDERAVLPPEITHAWVEYAGATITTSFRRLSANWNVPASPANNDGQTVYLFPGLEDTNDVVTILQPVLAWNADFKNAWGIASWNCCVSGSVNESAPVQVNVLDVIYGSMVPTCEAGVESCATWDVATYDVTTNKSTSLTATSSDGQTFNWAIAGALEVYDLVQCGDYPGDGLGSSFYNVKLSNYKNAEIANPAWKVENVSSGLSPQCNYGGSLPKQLTLAY